MNDFIVQLLARLDATKALSDIKQIEQQLNAKGINLRTTLDTVTSKQQLQTLAKNMQSVLASQGLNIDTSHILSTLKQLQVEINNTATSATKIQNALNTGSYNVQVAQLESQFRRLGLSQDEVATKMKGVQGALQSLSVSGLSQEELIQRERLFNTELVTTSNQLKILQAEMGGFATAGQKIQLTNKITSWLQTNTRATTVARQQLENYLQLLNSGAPITNQQLTNITNGFAQINNEMRTAGKLGSTVFGRLGKSIKSFTSYISSMYIIMTIIRTIKGMITSVKELDTALVDLKKTTTMTNSQLEEFYQQSTETAKRMGVTTKEIIEQASAWSRLGYSSQEAATKMAEYSSMFATISPGMDLDSATDGLVSVMKAFKIGAEDVDDVVDGIMSKINIIGNTQALNNSDIVDFLTRSSSAMAEANNSLEETIALGTAATEITRDASSVGNMLKTVSMRINKIVPLYGDI